MRSFLGEIWGSCQKGVEDDGMAGKERKVDINQSTVEVSDKGGFPLTFYLSDIEINDCATVGITKT